MTILWFRHRSLCSSFWLVWTWPSSPTLPTHQTSPSLIFPVPKDEIEAQGAMFWQQWLYPEWHRMWWICWREMTFSNASYHGNPAGITVSMQKGLLWREWRWTEIRWVVKQQPKNFGNFWVAPHTASKAIFSLQCWGGVRWCNIRAADGISKDWTKSSEQHCITHITQTYCTLGITWQACLLIPPTWNWSPMHMHQNVPHKPQYKNGCQWNFISLACCDEVVLNNSAASSLSASLCMCRWLHGCHKCAAMCEKFQR